jgi:ribosomal protein L11 methylase PrmA
MKFTQAWHELKACSEKRRAELLPVVMQRTNNTVVNGIFEGMTIVPKWSWGDGDHAAKLLGIYECELYDAVEEHLDSKPDLLINVGCAEGFWGIGCAMRSNAPLILVDVDAGAVSTALENAANNNVTVQETNLEFNPQLLEQRLSGATNPFLVMDCEGAEEQYLDPTVVPSLSKTRIVVETHDCFIPGISEKVALRFTETHNIELITQGAKNPYVDPINDFGDEDKWLLVNENRPHTMFWLNLTPKK